MDVSRTRALRGPNMWSRHTAIEAVVHCTDAERSLERLPGFEARLRQLFPTIGELRADASLAQVLEQATLALQAQAGCPVTFSQTHITPEAGTYQLVIEYSEEDVGRMAFEQALKLVQAALTGGEFDDDAVIAQLRELDEDIRLGPSTGSIVNAAIARGIPYRRLTQGSLVQFGWGAKQRRIWAAEVDATSAVSESIAQDKDLCKRLLQAAGVPVPTGRPVDSPDDGWAVAEEIGLPVVVKPQDGNQGKGVTVNVVTREHFEIAYKAADEIGPVMVEKFLPGSDYRLLVIGDKLIAAARRDPPHVIGDGVHTVKQLVDKVNADPRRGDGHATSLTKIRFDDIAVARLTQQGLSPESVPEKGQRVILRNNANLSTGGTATDVTDDVHPEVAARAIAAAQVVGLHVCGVDVVAESVLRPLEEINGGIVEVNAAPGLRMHLSPSFGKGRNVGEAIVGHLFGSTQKSGSAAEDGRIPVVAVTGTNGKTTVTRLIAHLFASCGLKVGMTNTDGVYVDGRQIDSGDCSGPKSARNVLMHPDVEAAVLETARGGILREGLGFDRCQVAVVTNVGAGDHLGMNFLHTAEDLVLVKRVIVQNVAPNGYAVLNATDPLTAQMAAVCPGQAIYFAADRHHPLMATHRAQGKRCVYVDGDQLVAAQGVWRESIPLRDIPLTRGGLIGFQVENAMAAVAAAWGVGLDWDTIRRGVGSFANDADNAPGRFNVMDYKGATVIADYGHNGDAMKALVGAVAALPANKRSVVISGAGDRRDEDIRVQTEILGAAFDEVILYEDACQRGRAAGEVVALLRQGLQGASRTRHIEEIVGEFIAIDRALARLQPGDLCLVLVDQVEEALAHLARRIAEG
ncbi:cyanophycin synthetase [Roseateles saccharophilus]|uniref:Cyanophycin synthetase n=1 Tax=Roseateles saccharophilus TaxID=304 RepID=A0A4R3V0S4_ROSSA|nr:cyanophycin synthetase [Roseateles saccharophilus]MDG0832387.1 cyanophycin synthetase [Roseateles saccharophilus]TCU97082.1 cyanophycin synthetase [Roseateles saccharophilus]